MGQNRKKRRGREVKKEEVELNDEALNYFLVNIVDDQLHRYSIQRFRYRPS